MAADAYRALGAFLTAFEAEQLAAALQAGYTASQALREVHQARRAEAKRLLTEADLGPHRVEASVSVLQTIAGARSVRTTITPSGP
jgi:hypothetical protein